MRARGVSALALLAGLWAAPAAAAPDGVIRVGSKSFTESYVLAEAIAQVVEQVGEARAERRGGLGGTGLTQRALESRAIDIYPEYTGTLARVILKDPALDTVEKLRARLEPGGLTISGSLGFANTYALAVRSEQAERLGLRTIGDLARHPELRAAFSSGFLERDDGWPGLRARYGLGLNRVEVMEHAVTYRAIASGQVDVMDVFSTDGQLERLRLRLLRDDRNFFPDYSAVLLARRDLIARFPRTWNRLREVFEGRLDGARMARLNAMADLDGRPVPEVAATFLGGGAPDIPHDHRGVLARREQPAPVGGEAGGDDRAVVAPERELSRWFPWWEDDLVERLVGDGRLTRPEKAWVSAAETASARGPAAPAP